MGRVGRLRRMVLVRVVWALAATAVTVAVQQGTHHVVRVLVVGGRGGGGGGHVGGHVVGGHGRGAGGGRGVIIGLFCRGRKGRCKFIGGDVQTKFQFVKFTLKCLDLFLLGCVVLGAHFSGVLIKDRPAKTWQRWINIKF